MPRGDDHTVIINSDNRIDAYDASTGELLWYVGPPTRVPVASPIWANGVLYTSRGYRSGPYFAVRTGGSGDVNTSHVLWQHQTGAPYTSSLLYHDGLVYLATENGVVSAVDAANGETVWKERLGGYFSASPVAADGKIYLLNEEGEAFVLKAGRQFVQLSKTEFPERLMASPIAANGRVFIRSDGRVYAFDS